MLTVSMVTCSPDPHELESKTVFLFQKFNADYDLSAKEGADSLAFISLMDEKLKPALVRLPLHLHPPLPL